MVDSRMTYNKKADVWHLQIQKGKNHVSEEVAEGMFIDYTKSGKVLSAEIREVSKRVPKKIFKLLSLNSKKA